jgi:hypothetical protein
MPDGQRRTRLTLVVLPPDPTLRVPHNRAQRMQIETDDGRLVEGLTGIRFEVLAHQHDVVITARNIHIEVRGEPAGGAASVPPDGED